MVQSFLLFERLTIGRLDDAGRQRFHEEQLRTVAPLGLPPERVPPTVAALDAYVEQIVAGGVLRLTEGARSVLSLVLDPPPEVPRRWLWKLVSFLALHTLPPTVRDLYGIRHTRAHALLLAAFTGTMRRDRPLLPPRLRFIAPANAATARLRGDDPTDHEVGLFARPEQLS